ncbi:AraC family transcriptional regulator [Gallibacterium trehalosifermentans]|uniref:AraC family transcriptional regulator n=1 Tax=Gallibacterium trehalosifermentans TaxID=516935 RepID=A0ABV6H485_9PAST
MDILDTLLSFAQLSGNISMQCHFQQEWYVPHQDEQSQGIVHIVTQGKSYLKLENNEKTILINEGDVIFFPRAKKHILSNNIHFSYPNNTSIQNKNNIISFNKNHSQKIIFSLLCVKFNYNKYSDLFNNLPETIILNLKEPSLKHIISILQEEIQKSKYGSISIINSLSEVLLILLVRTYLAQENTKLTGVLNGLQDKRLYKVINNIIQQPEKKWNVTQLSEAANLSKSQLIRLFNQQIGFSPHTFITHIRLQKAAKLLHSSQENILSIALNCGFQSETNFGKAFKKYFGITASQYRKNRNI